jgi:hypothetical protein
MKKRNIALCVALGLSSGTSYGADGLASVDLTTPPLTQAAAETPASLTVTLDQAGKPLCNALVLIYPTHINVRFSDCAPQVKEGWKQHDALLATLRDVISGDYPELRDRSFLNVVYAP